MRIKTVLEFPAKLPKPFLTIFAFILVLTIGSIDITTGYNNVSVAFLYLFPIILITWFEGGTAAAVISIFSALTWSIADMASGPVYSHFSIPLWNAVMVLGMFSIVAYSFATIKKLSVKEREHARSDDVTRAANAAFFYEEGQREIRRAARYRRPLTLVRFCIKDYDRMVGALGQRGGEDVLRAVADTVMQTLRTTDIVARLEDDAFAILMPETKNKDAEVAVQKVQEHLAEMMKRNGWQATFSLGVVTCPVPTCSMDALIAMAEALMKTGRGDAGNSVRYQIADQPPSALVQG